jgi:hypothetical protein
MAPEGLADGEPTAAFLKLSNGQRVRKFPARRAGFLIFVVDAIT